MSAASFQLRCKLVPTLIQRTRVPLNAGNLVMPAQDSYNISFLLAYGQSRIVRVESEKEPQEVEDSDQRRMSWNNARMERWGQGVDG